MVPRQRPGRCGNRHDHTQGAVPALLSGYDGHATGPCISPFEDFADPWDQGAQNRPALPGDGGYATPAACPSQRLPGAMASGVHAVL